MLCILRVDGMVVDKDVFTSDEIRALESCEGITLEIVKAN